MHSDKTAWSYLFEKKIKHQSSSRRTSRWSDVVHRWSKENDLEGTGMYGRREAIPLNRHATIIQIEVIGTEATIPFAIWKENRRTVHMCSDNFTEHESNSTLEVRTRWKTCPRNILSTCSGQQITLQSWEQGSHFQVTSQLWEYLTHDLRNTFNYGKKNT